jgi:hypothetical protein
MDNTASTAIARKKPSVPCKWLFEKTTYIRYYWNANILDYGCGRGEDADHYDMYRYDPNSFPTMPDGKYDAILCTYVFNVIDDLDRKRAAYNMLGLLDRNGGVYITVRRDLPKGGKQGRKCWQHYVTLPFAVIRETPTYCIYKATKDDLINYLDNEGE